jgi:anti-sigma28 factor (negative regulator of flagellin synthesis)
VKINERDVLNIPKPQSERLYEAPKPTAGSPSSAKPSFAANDRIELGGQAGLVSQVQTAGSDGRSTRVEELKALVQSGQYQVDTAALSQSIVNATVDGY